MFISTDSPLRRPPNNLNPKQAQFLDGVRLCVEMTDLAYQALVEQLRAFTPDPGNTASRMLFTAPAFMFAWSIIDSVHRLRGLVDHFPGIEKRQQIPEIRGFLDKAASVESLRHAVQHMEGTIRQEATQGHAVWGYLSWAVNKKDDTVLTCLLTAGALMPNAEYKTIPNSGVAPTGEIENVKLNLGDAGVQLSELLDAVSKLVGFMEPRLKEQFEGTVVRAESDYFIALAMKRNPDGSLTMPATDAPPTQ
jgi:hypothetical protein